MRKYQDLDDKELVSAYGDIVAELRNREIIRTKNVVGDLGERFAIDYYTQSPSLESMKDAPPSTKSIDAVGENGNGYAIKSITGKLTGVFYGLPHKDSDEKPEQLFDYLLIVLFNDSYQVKAIYELSWGQFLEYKKWHSRMEAWNMPLNNTVKNASRIVYEAIT